MTREVLDDNQEDTMNTKPEWFIEFENKQEQRWKEQQEFNQQILSLIQSIINRVENIEHRLDKLESRIDNLVVKNNLNE